MLDSAFGSTVEELATSIVSKTTITTATNATATDKTNEKPVLLHKDNATNNECLEKQQQQQQEQSDCTTATMSDEELVSTAMAYYYDDKLLAAARLLEQVADKNNTQNYSKQHQEIIEKAKVCHSMIEELLQSPPIQSKDSGDNDCSASSSSSLWKNQGQYKSSDKDGKNQYSTQIYYKMDSDDDKQKGSGMKLTVRLETPIKPSMLVPLLSVLNESELYSTWLPSWTKPVRLGVTESKKLYQSGRCNQIVSLISDVPWPLCQREVILSALGIDDIDENNHIAVKLQSLDTGDTYGEDGKANNDSLNQKDKLVIPAPNKNTTRLELDGGCLFRKCPVDHPSLSTSTNITGEDHKEEKNGQQSSDDDNDIHDDDYILVCFSFFVDAKINFLPSSVINFVIRTVIGKMWSMFLHVAQDVRDGKRPAHAKAIEQKRDDLYNWVDERVQIMLSSSSSLSSS